MLRLPAHTPPVEEPVMIPLIGSVLLSLAASVVATPEPPKTCDDVTYVPGVTADGRKVAPADLTPPVNPVIDSFVVVEAPTRRNPAAGNVAVGVDLEGLDRALNPPPCHPPVRQRRK